MNYSSNRLGKLFELKAKNSNKIGLWDIFPFFVLTLLMLTVLLQKSNFHVDEVFSYGLANHQNGILMSFEDGKTYTPAVLPYSEYMTVNPMNRFSWKNVWNNQALDVHPPLYYFFVHAICSLFPGQFSVFFAGVINIVFALITLYFFRRCIQFFTDDQRIQFLLSIAFAISPGILSEVSFLRMYVMAMCWVTITFCVFLEDLTGAQKKSRFFAKLAIVAIAGALTHYYCIVFTVFISLIYAICLLFTKQFERIVGLIATGVVAGIVSYVLFPPMINHMFSGPRGEESIGNLKAPLQEFISRLIEYIHVTDKELFGELGLILLILIMVYWLIINLFRTKALNNKQDETCAWFILYFPCLLYFAFVAKSAPYITDRYMFPIYALLLLAVFLPALLCVKKYFSRFSLVASFLVVIVTTSTYMKCGWNYIYKDTRPLLQKAQLHSSVDCIYVYDQSWKTLASFKEVQSYRSVTFISETNLEMIESVSLDNTQQLMLMTTAEPQKILIQVQKYFPNLNIVEEEGSLGYSVTYYLHE